MRQLVIPGLRADLQDVDLVVDICRPALQQGIALGDSADVLGGSADVLGTCTLRRADGSLQFSLCCTRDQRDLWSSLYNAYLYRTRFRATAK